MHQAAGLRIPDQGASRNPNLQIGSVLSRAAFALAVRAVGGSVFSLITEVHQGRHIIIRDKDNASATAAVSSVRTAGRDVFFSVERDRTVSALSGVQVDSCFINK